MSLVFRPCRAADAADAVPLIHASGPVAFRYVFAQQHAAQSLGFLERAFSDGAGEFGLRNHVAVEQGGRLVAVAARWDGRSNLRFTLAAARQIIGFYGLAALPVMARGIAMERVVRPPRADRAYIGHVAVRPELRGGGIGRALVGWLLQAARDEGFRVAALDVADDNPRARALYEGLGFRCVATRRSTLAGPHGRVVDHHYLEAGL